MWIYLTVRLVLLWTILSIVLNPSSALLQYTAAELLQLRFHAPGPPPMRYYPNIASPPYRKYTHRGSRRSYHIDDSTAINSIWSTTRHRLRNSGRKVDCSVLAHLPRATANVGSSKESSDIKVGLLNIRSLTGKGHLLQDLLLDRKYDFLCLTETWQQPNDFSQLNEAIPSGFVYTCQPRLTGRGGGLAIIHRDAWKISSVTLTAYSSFESLAHCFSHYLSTTRAK